MQHKKYDYCQSCNNDDLSAVSGDSYHSDNSHSHGCGGGTVRQYDDDLLGTEVSLDDDCLVDPIAETEITEELICILCFHSEHDHLSALHNTGSDKTHRGCNSSFANTPNQKPS